MRAFRVNGAVAISCTQLPLEPFVANPRELDPSIDLRPNPGAFVHTTARVQTLHHLSILLAYTKYAASMTSDEVRGAWCGVRSIAVSVLFSDTVRPGTSKTATMTVAVFARRSAVFYLKLVTAWSACSMPHTALGKRDICSGFPPTRSSWR